MALTGGSAVATRLGGRPAAEARSGCASCGHPFALHSNGETPCRAFACTKGHNGQPCQAFTGMAYGDVYPAAPEPDLLAS